MSTSMWFKGDIANTLLSACNSQMQGARLFGGGSRDSQLYLAGVRDLAATIALAFGISPALVIPEETQGGSRRMLEG